MSRQPRATLRLSPRLTYIRLLTSVTQPRPTPLPSLPPTGFSRPARTRQDPRDSDERDVTRDLALFITGEIVFGVGLAAGMLWVLRFLLP